MKQRGMALLMVLLMVATMAAVAVSSQEYWQQAFSRAESQQFRQQAKWTLLGAEEWVRLQQVDRLPEDAVHAGQTWARNVQNFELDGIRIAWQLSDNQACFNLNAITPPKKPDDADPVSAPPRSASQMPGTDTPAATSSETPREALPRRVFRHLLVGQGLSTAQASELINALAAVTPVTEISQIRALPGVNRALWQKLQPLVCASADVQQRININTLRGETGAALLMALSQGYLSRSQAQRRLAARPVNGWAVTTDIAGKAISPEAATAIAESASLMALTSHDMTLLLQTEQAPHTFQLRSRLQRTEDAPFRVTERRYGITD